ncbi:MAG: family 78 glycoside hydrolase catalytic domain [Verrucomicrobiota bacterium]
MNIKKLRTITFVAMLMAGAVAALMWLGGAQAAFWKSGIRPTRLRCEYRENPLGIDIVNPRLGWELDGYGQGNGGEAGIPRGLRQTAYQLLVASSEESLKHDQGDLWDSGKVASEQSIQVGYQGKPLESRMRCYWKVRVWDQRGKATDWSEPALWTMGLLAGKEPASQGSGGPAGWKAQWIGYDAAYQLSPGADGDDRRFNIQGLEWLKMPGPNGKAGVDTCFRKCIEIPAGRKLRRAVLALYAFNFCEAAVNGTAVGQAAHWERTARLDATHALHAGANVVTLMVSHTDPYPPAVIGRLVMQFDSGDDWVVPLDKSWKVSQNPSAGFEKPDFDDAAWSTPEAGRWPWGGIAAPVADLARVPAPYLRKDFAVAGAIKRATVYVTALGAYELHLNGKRVGQDVLTPGWTEFRKRVHYQTYDVTALVAKGPNAIGAILGDGWYASDLAHLCKRNVYGGKPRFLAQLMIELADGSLQTVVSDGSWKANYGPIRHADLLLGCEYDARLEMAGWDQAGFVENGWNPVQVDAGAKSLKVQASVAEPSRVIDELPAIRLTEPRPGCWTFDLGQNMVGWVRLKVRGAAGQRITVRHAEMTNPDGTIYTAALRSCPATDFFILSGKGEEILEPYFTFHGFRYVEVRGLTSKPELDMVTGRVAHTLMRRTGRFECSHPLLNQLYSNIIWGQKGNYLEVPTDCPQRDERMGWTGDTQFFAPTAAYNFDVATFFSRWLQTCEDDQNGDGTFPWVVPNIWGGGGCTGWGDAALLCTYNVYRAYGDTRIVAERFAAMESYMKWLEGKTQDGISKVGGFGDWLNAGGGAKAEAMDTAYHAHLARIMSEMAQAIGREDDARRYAQRHDQVKAAFMKAFLQPDGALKDCSQTGYALAFSMDLLPADRREQVASKFVEEIKRFKWHLATGFIGTPRLLPALSAAGRDDVAYRLLLTDTYPSWLFPVKNGATTMWERWDGWTPDKGFGAIGMNSFNHYAFGAVGEYLYGGVGGIKAASPGYKTILIRPACENGLAWAKTSFDSMYGRIVSNWKREGAELTMEVTIPPNTSAKVYVPTADASTVTESGKPTEKADGVKFLDMENGRAVYAVGSGNYRFKAGLPGPVRVMGME